jgi:Domain of unknown function (DUF1772)
MPGGTEYMNAATAGRTPTSLAVVRIVAVIATGLLAGVLCGDRLGATYGRAVISTPSLVQFQQAQHSHFMPMLLPVTLVAVIASIAWMVMMRTRRRSVEFRFALAGAVGLLIAVAITRVVNSPINDALMTWNAGFPPYDVRATWLHWERAHTWRTAACVLAFVLQAIALGTAEAGRSSDAVR